MAGEAPCGLRSGLANLRFPFRRHRSDGEDHTERHDEAGWGTHRRPVLTISVERKRPRPGGLVRQGEYSFRQANYLLLAVVPDPIDRAGLIIRDQERAIHRVDRHVSRAAPVLVVLDPTPSERLLRDVLAIRVGLDADDPGAGVHDLVPAAMLGEEDVVLELSREVVPGVELHPKRRH